MMSTMCLRWVTGAGMASGSAPGSAPWQYAGSMLSICKWKHLVHPPQPLLHVLTNLCRAQNCLVPCPTAVAELLQLRWHSILPLHTNAAHGCAGRMGARTAAETGSATGIGTAAGIGTVIGTLKGIARGSARPGTTATAATGAATGLCISLPSTALAQQNLPFKGDPAHLEHSLTWLTTAGLEPSIIGFCGLATHAPDWCHC